MTYKAEAVLLAMSKVLNNRVLRAYIYCAYSASLKGRWVGCSLHPPSTAREVYPHEVDRLRIYGVPPINPSVSAVRRPPTPDPSQHSPTLGLSWTVIGVVPLYKLYFCSVQLLTFICSPFCTSGYFGSFVALRLYTSDCYDLFWGVAPLYT